MMAIELADHHAEDEVVAFEREVAVAQQELKEVVGAATQQAEQMLAEAVVAKEAAAMHEISHQAPW
jgi:energy-coupling factor transporter ATP-binding protein EcfA2